MSVKLGDHKDKPIYFSMKYSANGKSEVFSTANEIWVFSSADYRIFAISII